MAEAVALAPWEMEWKAAPAEQVPQGEELPWEQDWEAKATRENRERRDAEWEQVFQEWEMVRQSGAGKDEHWDNMIASHRKNVEADAASEAAILDQIIKGASADAVPDLQALRDQFAAEQAEQARVLSLIERDAGMTAQAQAMQDEDFERMVTERELMRRSVARQDQAWKKFFERRASKAPAQKKAAAAPESRIVPMRQLEERLRGLRTRERLAGQMASDAQAGGDKAAWERATKIIDKLYGEREEVRGKIRKLDPKREEALYDELYLR